MLVVKRAFHKISELTEKKEMNNKNKGILVTSSCTKSELTERRGGFQCDFRKKKKVRVTARF